MAKVLRSIQTARAMRGSFAMTCKTAMAFLHGQAASATMGSFVMANLTAKAFILGLMVNATRGNGAMTKKADKGL